MDVTITVTSGGGKVLVGKELRDPSLAKVARRRTVAERAVQLASATATTTGGPSITEQLLICPFKAAPFRDLATGLCFMRDRRCDPSTGTFLTPDRAGNRDSSNLYIFGITAKCPAAEKSSPGITGGPPEPIFTTPSLV